MPKEDARIRLIFHIGLEKTGTTSFQRFCYENRNALLAHGALYPTQSLAFSRRSRNHASLVAAYLEGTGYVDLDMTPSWRGREETLASLRGEIDAAQAPTVLVSAEHFSSRLAPRQIEQLAQDFSDYDCSVAVVLRAHETRVCSAYSSTVRSGRALTLHEFVAELATPGNDYIRCAETVRRWESAFGRENVRMFSFEQGPHLIADLARALVGADFPAVGGARYADNKSYGAVALEALRRVNAELPLPDGSGRGAVQFRLAAFARKVLLNSFALLTRSSEAKLRLDAAQRAALSEIVETDRAWLKENYGLDMPPLGEETSEASDVNRQVDELLEKTRWPRAALRWLLSDLPG